MFKLAPKAPMKPAQEEAVSQPTVMESEAPDAAMDQMSKPMGIVSPEAARYFPGTCACNNCTHFSEPNGCEIVAGEIDPEGMCSLHTCDEQDMTEEQSEPVDNPAEEAAENQ